MEVPEINFQFQLFDAIVTLKCDYGKWWWHEWLKLNKQWLSLMLMFAMNFQFQLFDATVAFKRDSGNCWWYEGLKLSKRSLLLMVICSINFQLQAWRYCQLKYD